MHALNETALLRSIAEEGDENNGRLVLSDLLEEHGQLARAEFLRVQCELASSQLPSDRRQTLLERERSLLDSHRHEWIQAFGLPMEDVRFERGLIASMRLSAWDEGKILDAEYASRLAPLAELDLSGLGLDNDDLAAFARSASYPSLRKLILSDNQITSVHELAAATGLPKLETVFLFRNPIDTNASAVLNKATCFRLTNLDVGKRNDGYCLSPGEADMARRQYLREHLLPFVRGYFKTYDRLQSAMLCVAQYWADEANDAVHGVLIVSELFEPSLKGARSGYGEAPQADLNVPNTQIKGEYGEWGSSIYLYRAGWDDNSRAIPMWAAFAPEEGSQEYEHLEEV